MAIDRHREPVSLALRPSGAHDRGDAQDVIKRREAETPQTPQTQAEVLRVPIRSTDQEKENLRPEEGLPILDRCVGFPQKLHDLRNARPPSFWYFMAEG